MSHLYSWSGFVSIDKVELKGEERKKPFSKNKLKGEIKTNGKTNNKRTKQKKNI